MYDVIIIGAGPAGLTAAIYAQRAGLSTLLLEELVAGGQMVNTPVVENYPSIESISGADLSMNMMEHAISLGAKLEYEGVEKIDFSNPVKIIKTANNTYECKAVIIANGAKRRKLEVKGEEMYSGRGVSYCATCDGAFYKDKVTAIVGGGNTAIEDCLFLAGNCSEVHLIHRRDSFRAEKHLVDAMLAEPKIKVHYNTVVDEIYGDKTVTGIKISNTKTGEKADIAVSGVFVAVGLNPNNEIFEGVVEMQDGYIKADESCKTNIDGVFAAGDTRTKSLRQVVTATSDGAMAAVAAASYIKSVYK